MQWLKQRAWRISRDERGATAVLIVLLIIPMLGFGALAFDVSAQHAEKTQLQHGADAAALAIALSCGEDEATCEGASQSTGDSYIADNGGTPVAGGAEAIEIRLRREDCRSRCHGGVPALPCIVGRRR